MAIPYNLAIHIGMTNGVSSVLSVIAKDLLGLNMTAEKLEKTLNRLGTSLKLMVGGAAAIVGGIEILKGLEHVANKGEELIHQQNVMVRNGIAYNDVLKVTTNAFDNITKAVPTSTAADVLRTVSELQSVIGSVEGATAAAPTSLKMEALLHNLTGKNAEGEGFKLWRSMEMKGLTTSDPELAKRVMGALIQNISASMGKLDAGTYQAMAKTGGAAWIHADPKFIAGAGSVLAGDLGGDRAGTAMMTLYQLITGATTMSKQQYEVFKAAGLIDNTKVTTDKGGRINAQPGAIKGSLEHSDNLYEWVQSIIPGIHGLAVSMAEKDHGNVAKIEESLFAKIGRNRNATKLMTMFSDPGFLDQIQKDETIWARAQGVDKAYATMLGQNPGDNRTGNGQRSEAGSEASAKQAGDRADYGEVMAALAKQWDSLLMAVGGPVAKAAIPVLQSLTDVFNKLGSVANAHPEGIKIIAQALGYLAVGLIAVGGAAVLAGAAMLLPGGAVTMAIVGIGTAIASFGAMHFDVVEKIVSGTLKGMLQLGSIFIDAIASIPGKVEPAIMAMASALGSAIGSALMGIAGKVGGVLGGIVKGMTPSMDAPQFIPNSYHPGPSKTGGGQTALNRPIHVHSTIALNGKTLGRSTSVALAEHHRYSTQAPTTDWGVAYDGGDANFATG